MSRLPLLLLWPLLVILRSVDSVQQMERPLPPGWVMLRSVLVVLVSVLALSVRVSLRLLPLLVLLRLLSALVLLDFALLRIFRALTCAALL